MPDNPRIEELRRRVQKDPASIAFAQLAEEYRRSGEHDEAVRVCRTGLAKHPSYLSARVTLGRALIELAQYDEARTELDYVLRSAPENLAAIRGLAEIYQRRGELEEALKQYQTALAIAKHDPELEESVQELTRQLGGSTDVRTQDTPERRAPQRRVSDSPEARTGGAVVSPPNRVHAGTAPTAPVDVPPLALETFEPPADATAIPLSPELEAAADEFTRALQALDAITIDVPAPPLATQSFELPALSEEERLIPEQDWEHGAFSAPVTIPEALSGNGHALAGSPAPEVTAIDDLENWLDNIVLDRGKR